MRRVSAVFAAPVAAFLCMAYDASGQAGATPGEALKRAAAFRAANRDFLCYGFLEGDFVSPDGVVAARWTDAARRREAVAFANLTERPAEVSAFGQACTIAPYSFAMLRKNP